MLHHVELSGSELQVPARGDFRFRLVRSEFNLCAELGIALGG